ncbi:MAG: carboxypeptidase regulatory-like domain-containing protein [Acidobacteria bacterium]|nr:carboxypeptidase regulatory-like domain-containing protein [Acidobacteriota bacterium]
MSAPGRWLIVVLLGLAAGNSVDAGVAALVGRQAQRDQRVPARDRPAEAPVGTAVIAGVVVTQSEPQQPVRRVSVMLASGPVVIPRTAVTDDEGRFEFTGLAAGNYTLVGQKPAWVTAVYGARSASDTQGIPVAVTDGQRVAGLRLPMMRGAVVAGVVRLASGQPARDLAVQLLQVRTLDGRRQTATVAAPAPTNDLGAYRVFGLPPGDYVVQARSQPNMGQGPVLRQVTEAEVRWGDQQLAQAQALTAAAAAVADPPPPGPAVTYTSVYFPGTTLASDAAVITLRPGEERLGVDFSLSLVPTAKVAGTVRGPGGEPAAGATVTLQPEGGSDDLIGILMGGGRAATRPDGTFALTGVTPGRYSLTVRGTPQRAGAAPQSAAEAQMSQAIAMATAMAGAMGGGRENPATLWASEAIAVNGQDLGPLELELREGLTVAGTVIAEGGAVPPDAAAIRINVSRPSTGDRSTAMVLSAMGASASAPKEDGTFAVRGLMPGKYQLAVSGKPMRLNTVIPGMASASSGWVVKSIQWRGQDLADSGIDLPADVPVTGVVVTLTNRPAELRGRVLDAAGRPTGAFPIVVFSADRGRWGAGSRRVAQVQPASDGKFLVVGLPAGEYFLAAVTRLEPGDLADRQFLEDLVPSSLRITIGEGEKKTQDLKLASGG